MKSARLIDIRTNVLKWSQQKLADELGYARNSVSRMELGKQPIERVAELAVYWLMYRECQIVCNGFPDDDLTPEKSIDLQHDVAISPMQHDVAENPPSLQHDVALVLRSQFIKDISFLSQSEDYSDLTFDQKLEFLQRLDDLILKYFSNPGRLAEAEYDCLNEYLASTPDVWFNQRKARAFFRQHYRFSEEYINAHR